MTGDRVQIETPSGQVMWVTPEAAERMSTLPPTEQAQLREQASKRKYALLEALNKYYPKQD